MAKTLVKNYVFKPGMSRTGNLYPNAYSLLEQNKQFIQSETTAYIAQEVIDAVKCKRDIGYIIDGLAYDIALGTNYNAIFLGLTEVNSLDLSETVFRTFTRTQTAIDALSAVSGDATATTRSQTFWTELVNISRNGRDVASPLNLPNPTNATQERIDAKNRILNNITFLQAEINAWMDNNYPNHNHDVDKCSRDVKYALWAAAYDIIYTGNSASYDSAKFFNYYSAQGNTGITAEHQAQTVAAYRRLQNIIDEIVRGQSITPSSGNTETQNLTGGTVTATIGTAAANLIDIVADVVENGTGALPTKVAPSTGWASSELQAARVSIVNAKNSIIDDVTWDENYTYNQAKCERDVGYVIDAYLNDLRYDGNYKLYNTVKYYWDNGVAQVDGNRLPEIDTHAFIGELIDDYILTNTAYSALGAVSQVIDTTKTAETAAATKLQTLVNQTIAVITNGISAFGTIEENTVGYVKIQGKYDLNELLLITNVTTNDILFNFSDIDAGGLGEIHDYGADEDFVSYLQTTDGTTKIYLTFDTSSHSETDSIQIFVEKTENGKSQVIVRPYDFGTDAIERHRMAAPLSMLDADFEYGLQPTKWSAIGMMRGYPSIYEIPGTDTEVLSVTTDASTGTNGVGASLITVTTVGAHSFSVGTPITIKALETSVSGSARAEGSFVIINVPDNKSFQFYAKSKVGTTSGEELAAGYTQLREGGFYTGAGIEGAEFTVVSNGSAGTMVTQLQVPSGSNTVPFDGNAPEIGSPLTNALIPTGSQVTNVISNSAGGGEYLTLNIGTNASAGDTSLTLFDATGVEENLALDRGDGQAVFIDTVIGSTINLSGQLQQNVVSNSRTYANVTANIIQPSGVGLILTINRSGGSYTIGSIQLAGLGFEVNDQIRVNGSDLGGVDVTNDFIGTVSGVNANGGVTSITPSGTAVNGTATYTGVVSQPQFGNGIDARFDVTVTNGAYTAATPPAADISQGFVVNDRIIIPGNQLGGVAGTNDLTVKVTGIEPGPNSEPGNIATVTVEGGTPADVDEIYPLVPYTTNSVSGGGAVIDVRRVGTVYSVIVTNGGTNFAINDTITVLGTDLGGASPTNDLDINVDNIGASGEITATSVTGIAVNSGSYDAADGNVVVGSGALFDVAMAGGVYTVTLNAGGLNYYPDQELKIRGNILQGTTPTNDITITINSINATGTIQTFTATGTASNGTESYVDVEPINVNKDGSGATFDISRTGGTYTDIGDIDTGSNYEIGDKLKILGSDLDGATPEHDIIIEVTGVDPSNSNALTTFTTSFDGAEPGTQIPLYSTFTMTENTTAIIPVNDTITFSALATLEAVFPNAHGLVPGDTFIVATRSDTGTNNHNLADGAFLALSVPTTSSLRYNARAAGTISTATEDISGTIYARPDSFFVHRPFDGGVQLGTGGPQHGAQAIRQSKKYIRYQSGKGIMYTTGALFAPSYDLRSVTADGTEVGSVITVTTDDNDHGVQAGGIIRLLGIETPGYNSGKGNSTPPWFDYAVSEVIDERTFRIQAQRRLGDTTELVLTPTPSTCPFIVAMQEAQAGDNTNDFHAFFQETAQDGYVWGDVNQSGSFTIDDITEVQNYLNSGNGSSQAITDRIALMFAEAKSRRNTGAIEDIVGAYIQEADIGFGSQMSVVNWHGATVRSGIFDDQNGIFWEFDGTNISVVQRTGTQQIAGTIAIDSDSNLVTGTNTRFRDQLTAGDRIIIRGMTHVVTHVDSQSTMTVAPDFRGVNNISGAKINLVVDKKVKQEDFNLDTLDGNGPSGYDIDIAKMQMIGIQFSWYGAGFIDYMLRGSDGNFVFCHRMRNSNINTEAFMRSGNLPVRYEVTNEGPPGKLAVGIDNSQTTLELVDGSFFPTYGTIYVDNEIMRFTGRSGNTLTGLSRGSSLTNFQAGAERTYFAGAASPHTAKTGVILISSTITPLISHWGSAFLTDGGFDEDRGYIFSYNEPNIEITQTRQTAFMIRLAPSVSNAVIGDLGERELLNRAQLLLQGLEVTSDGYDGSNNPINGGIVVEGILNPQNYPLNPSDVGWSGLSSLAQGGQPSFAQVAAGGSVVWSTGQAAVTATATAIPTTNVDLTVYDRYVYYGNEIRISKSQYASTGPVAIGSHVSVTNTAGGFGTTNSIYATVISVEERKDYYRIRTSTTYSGYIREGGTVRFTVGETLTNRNYGEFTATSVDAAGVTNGTSVTSGGSVSFPAGTLVSNLATYTHGSLSYYRITFNNTYSGTLTQGSGTVGFEFVQPPYAQPGETIFSFVAVPGERSQIDFSELKELTNTPLGGRGTFPNGPDVLAINIYKPTGSSTTGNLVLKWGEAQA